MCERSLHSVGLCVVVDLFFFFSSRRRHTRCSRDWSSDVCSSDLAFAAPLEVLKSADLPVAGAMFAAFKSPWPARIVLTAGLFDLKRGGGGERGDLGGGRVI